MVGVRRISNSQDEGQQRVLEDDGFPKLKLRTRWTMTPVNKQTRSVLEKSTLGFVVALAGRKCRRVGAFLLLRTICSGQ